MERATQPGIRVGVNAAIVQDDAILLVAFNDESGPHFNFPGGGVEPGESLHEALRREVREETGAEVTVGPLLLVWEYVPAHQNARYGTRQRINLLFACALRPGSVPRLPDTPDPDQVAVRWIPLTSFPHEPLIPAIQERVLTALQNPAAYDPFCERI
jgi:ADP-ribose pyrophosphatase YjhB (NUDIX family)